MRHWKAFTNLQGTGGAELGDVMLMPVVGGLNWAWNQSTPGEGYCSRFSHECEEVRAAYSSVYLEAPGVKADWINKPINRIPRRPPIIAFPGHPA
jgi:hypothetical protein